MLALSLRWLGMPRPGALAGDDVDGDSQMLGAAHGRILESRCAMPGRLIDYVWRCGHILMGGRELGLQLVGAEFFVCGRPPHGRAGGARDVIEPDSRSARARCG